MKFTFGYWRIRDQYEPHYAVEYWDHFIDGDSLTVYAATTHIQDRGDTMNRPMLTVQFSSPIPNVIRVSLAHFEGVKQSGPNFSLTRQPGEYVQILAEENKLIFRSDKTEAVIDTRPNSWHITFLRDGKELTDSGYRNEALMVDRKTGDDYLVEQLLLDVGESVYGLGERFTPFVKNGQEVQIWNEDGGTASEQAYKNIPFYVSSRGYGVFVDDPGDVQFEVGSEKVERVQFSLKTERLDYCVLGGRSPKETVQLYTALLGRPALPPAWTFGLWLTTSFTTNYDEKTVTGFIQGMQDRHIPLHVFHFDCFWMKGFEWVNFKWDEDTFPDPKGMLKRYHDRGLHICCWINSYVGQKSSLFQEGMKNGYFLKRTDGSVFQWDLWQAGMALVDFTNPDACKWYQSKLKALLDMGVDCFKTDFGERIPVQDVVYFDHSDPVRMHNYYTYLYNKTVFELLEKQRGKGEACLFARSATAGSEKFPVHWGGDCTATYQSMAEDLRGGLSLSMCGFGFWSHDMGGFEQTASADVYKRWCQFGLLSSHSRLHGSQSYRVPWLFDDEACDVLRTFVNLKCTLMPYLYGKAVEAHEKGIPVMRPMVMEFPDDPTCASLDRQYMLGDRILVAPIFSKTGTVTYYLPDGLWTNYLTNKTYEGGHWYTEHFDYFHLPMMIRENTILPIGRNDQRPDYDYWDNTILKVYAPKQGRTIDVDIPNMAGTKKLHIHAAWENDVLKITADGGTNLTSVCVNDPSLTIDFSEKR